MPTIEQSVRIGPLLSKDNLLPYFEGLFGRGIRIRDISPLGGTAVSDVKGYGYGTPIKIDYDCQGERRSAVLETIRPGPFGHEHLADRARILLTSHAAYNKLPRHVHALDVGAFAAGDRLISLADANEYFILDEYVTGEEYYKDLEQLRDRDELRILDLERADALCDYLLDIHRVSCSNPQLYTRRIRELVGDSECIAGVLDSYPVRDETAGTLEAIERACVQWRWRLKTRTQRLRQVHGDFHPWNILFRQDADFTVLDRSRGEWGEPADDVTALTLNYVFFSLQRHQRLTGPLEALFLRFWDRYLEESGDSEMLDVVAPFFAFRGLVMASPIWYPNLQPAVRAMLLRFVRSVLDQRRFEPERVNEYCHG